ncbi:ThiF family adenylyltransferase [Nostoc sp. C110]|uniref:ThiF family adenylyltransferase n=1 Tax=Nostoc sp. C110 TaxID=3349876 RepID=UPI00370D53AE
MSQQLISRSIDLKRLQDEGFDLEINSGYLLVKNIPYLNSNREIKYGMLVSELTLAGDVTTKPSTHVIEFGGDHPCHKDGTEITQIKHASTRKQLTQGVEVQHTFSSKPPQGYSNYYEKLTTYIAIISSPAQAIDPAVTAKNFSVIQSEEGESPFCYHDTASSRAGINLISQKLALEDVAIIGLGGTGTYVLDLVAKTPVKRVHLFDGDKLFQHNAFRSPGAPSIDELREIPYKVIYFKELYSKMHQGIVPHAFYIEDEISVNYLKEMKFVFLCLDRGTAKKLIIEKLEEFGIPFIDVGIGVNLVDESLGGILRVTTSTIEQREHINKRVSFSDNNGNNDYAQNIQIADLNALNAALAVIKWKKIFGFYRDFNGEHNTTYTIDGNTLINEDQLEG